MGEEIARQRAQLVFSNFAIATYIVFSRLRHDMSMLVASANDVPEGVAYARLEAGKIVLYLLYVDPERQGHGIGSSLLQAVCIRYPRAKEIRLEVLKDNVSAIAWYEARGFEIYGENANATGLTGIASLYMDKKLHPDGAVQGST